MSNDLERIERLIREAFPEINKAQGWDPEFERFSFRYPKSPVEKGSYSNSYKSGLWFDGGKKVDIELRISAGTEDQEIKRQVLAGIEQDMRRQGLWRNVEELTGQSNETVSDPSDDS